jgi:DNA-binding NarL/FixJ family response regulator
MPVFSWARFSSLFGGVHNLFTFDVYQVGPRKRRMIVLHITPLERTVLECLANGAALREIAGRLGLDEREVELNLTTLFVRMGVRTRAEAVAAAVRRGLLAV